MPLMMSATCQMWSRNVWPSLDSSKFQSINIFEFLNSLFPFIIKLLQTEHTIYLERPMKLRKSANLLYTQHTKIYYSIELQLTYY